MTGEKTIEKEFHNLGRNREFRRSGWRRLARAVKRRKWTLCVCVAASWVGAGAYLLKAPAVLETSATVYVQALNAESTGTGGIVDLQPTIMRSASVAAVAVSAPEIGTLPLLAGERDPVGFIESRLGVSAGGRPGVFTLTLASSRPADAEKLLNAIVASYINFEMAQQRQSVDQLESDLREQRRKTSEDLAAAKQRLDDLVKRQGDSNPTTQSREQFALDRAQAAAALADARERATDARAAFDTAVQFFGTEENLKKAAAGMGVVILTESDLDSALSQLAQFQTTPPTNQAERHEQAVLKGQYAAAVLNRYDAASQEEGRLQSRFEEMEKQAGDVDVTDDDYARLQNQTDQLISLDSKLSDRLNHWDATQQDQVAITALAPAQTDQAPIWPRPLPVLGFSTLAGILLGIGLAKAVDLARMRLQDAEDACDFSGAPLLGRMQPMPWELTTMELRGQCVLLRPSNSASHAIEDVRVELEKVLGANFYRTVLVTSPAKALGKSLLASNLAISMAQNGFKVALVDTNYSRPAVNETFGIADQIGLSQAIEGPLEVREALHVTEMENLEILSVGCADANWAELFNQPEFEGVLNQLTERCERVVIDGTNVTSDECVTIGAFCDATILVVDPRKGKRRELRSAAERLRRVGAKLVGIVLNEVPRCRKAAVPKLPLHEIGDFRALAEPELAEAEIEEDQQELDPQELDPHAAPVDAVLEQGSPTAEPTSAPEAAEEVKETDEPVDVWGLRIY